MKPVAIFFSIFLFPVVSNAFEFEKALAVLERNCISCHNADDKKGKIVLDRAPVSDKAIRHLIDSVSGPDPEMPEDRDPLSAKDIALLKTWIEAGGPIPEGRALKDTYIVDRKWWSLSPLKKPETPKIQSEWARNEIDQFVLAKMSEKGLTPSPQADARTLIRRLTYDLTGLPPSPDRVESFIQASKSDPESAWEELVDQLLASPGYGEHWGRHWLDVARYGESHGYDKDKARFNAWPYRDYVIESFNDDKSWTRFVQEQIAGDVLFPNDPKGIIALGFVAAGPWDFISHTEVGEGKLDGRIAKHMDRDDMVSAVFNAFMSTTVQCAQCHNHKFDPVSMEDYYRTQAVFAAVDRAPRIYDVDNKTVLKRLELEEEIAALQKENRDIDKQLVEKVQKEYDTLTKTISILEKEQASKRKIVPEHGYHSTFSKTQSTEKWIQLSFPDKVGISRLTLRACYDDFGGIGEGFGFPVRYRIESADDIDFKKNVRTIGGFTKTDVPNPKLIPLTTENNITTQFLRLTATKLARRKDVYILALGEMEVFDKAGNNIAKTAAVSSLDSIEALPRWGKKNLVDSKFSTGGSPELFSAALKRDALIEKQKTPQIKARFSKIGKKSKALKQQLAELPEGKMVYAIATNFKPRSNHKPTQGKPRKIHLLHRGDVASPEEEMPPGAPALWGKIDPVFPLKTSHTEGDRRACLAHYLTSQGNPLTWRSIVNRIWLHHFGRGIVETPNDFGRMGGRPSHPELLDWLAATFRDDPAQSMKKIHRLLVTSSTWRQTSQHDPGKAAIDASNVYYWHLPRRKLKAEEVRDSVLVAAGKLDRKMGGPSFQDFTFKDDHTPKFWYHLHDPNDPKTHRRAVYRFIARSQTQPFLTTLDCADPSQMVAKRDETTTALQALVLLNNPFMTKMAEHFASRIDKDVNQAIRIAFGRAATEYEKKLLGAYETEHGWPATCRVIMNLNEFVYID